MNAAIVIAVLCGLFAASVGVYVLIDTVRTKRRRGEKRLPLAYNLRRMK